MNSSKNATSVFIFTHSAQKKISRVDNTNRVKANILHLHLYRTTLKKRQMLIYISRPYKNYIFAFQVLEVKERIIHSYHFDVRTVELPSNSQFQSFIKYYFISTASFFAETTPLFCISFE